MRLTVLHQESAASREGKDDELPWLINEVREYGTDNLLNVVFNQTAKLVE